MDDILGNLLHVINKHSIESFFYTLVIICAVFLLPYLSKAIVDSITD